MGQAFGTPVTTGAINTLTGNSTQQPNYEATDLNGASGVGISGDASLGVVLQKLQTGVAITTVTSTESASVNAAASYLVATNQDKLDSPTLGLDALVLAYKNGYLSDTAFLIAAPLGTPLPKASDSLQTSDWVVLSTAIPAISTVVSNALTQSAQIALAATTFTIPSGETAQVGIDYRLSRAANGTATIGAPAAAGSVVEFKPDWTRIAESAVTSNQYVLTVAGVAYQTSAAAVAAVAAGIFEYRYVVKAGRSTRNSTTTSFSFGS